MPFFSRFKNKGAQPASKGRAGDLTNGKPVAPKPQWQSTWSSKTVVLEEVQELVHMCTAEMKSRAEALDSPFLLLPFRPDSDSSSARTFIRNFFKSNQDGSQQYRGQSLQQELRLTEPIVLCSVLKWCWSRLPSGVVSWPVYEGFQIGEKESKMARNAFDTFIPISAESEARKTIIFDFYDLMAAVAAHGKMNGLGGRKLSRLAGWWAFEHTDEGKGFEGGYRSWTAAADASSHLFFAYLRSLSPELDPSMSLIERIPRSLQALQASTEYPPETPTLLQRTTPRVVMLVDIVSPTPFALLRRAKHFEYRDKDHVLREYSEFEDPLDALTEECKRVLYAVSSTNSSAARSRHRMHEKADESWSAFQNMGFADMDENSMQKAVNNAANGVPKPASSGMQSEPRSRNADFARPTTPSWADFLSSGFQEDDVNKASTTLLLPPDKVLPPLGSRSATPSHLDNGENLAPGELAAITDIELDDAFWWVWMTSLAGEEPAERKAVFGRCALIETTIMNGGWLIMEEQVKGASPDPMDGAYLVPKKSFFSFTKRGKLGRKRSLGKAPFSSTNEPMERVNSATPSKSSLAPDQHSKIKQAAAALTKKKDANDTESIHRRGRYEDGTSTKTNSMLTIGLQSEAGPAMKWTSAYDKKTIRAQYLGDAFAGKGVSREDLVRKASSTNINQDGASSVASPVVPATSPEVATFPPVAADHDLPSAPREEQTPAAVVAPPVRSPEPITMPQSLPTTNDVTADAAPKQQETEKVPPPTTTTYPQAGSALDKELAVDAPSSPIVNKVGRKPVPSSHPALRPTSEDEPTTALPAVAPVPQTPVAPTQNPAAIAAQKAMDLSPESTKSGTQRGKKQGGNTTGGLKKLFGRKKDSANRESTEVTRPNTNSLILPSDQNFARRLSMMRRKPGQAAVAKASPAAEDRPATPEFAAEPVMPESHGQFDTSTGDLSRTDTRDREHAEQEFSRFDQGPVADIPAATPQSSTEHMPAPQAQRQFNTRLAQQIAPRDEDEDFSKPMEHKTPTNDAASETTMDDAQDKDRWATIRENAARRAARASEEHSVQSRPSQSARTDDGETSGEETIESRVARIKARVAELTGGMDNNAARR